MDIDWEAVRCELRSLLVVNPQLYPDKIEITDESYSEFKVVGAPGDIVEVWGGVRLEYVKQAKWAPILFFGIEVHLD